MLYPLKFRPILKHVLWGGTKIESFKGLDLAGEKIGESWEVSAVPGSESVVANGEFEGMTLVDLVNQNPVELLGERIGKSNKPEFPLLVKFIDAKKSLSLQVHPNDDLAQKRHHCPGKNEMWYIINTFGESKIIAGMSHSIEPEEYESLVKTGEILDRVACHESHPGDIFFIPAGRVHGIGPGNLLIEVQQSSDITYRLFDYNRLGPDGKPRQLHVDQAYDAIDFNIYDNYREHLPEPQLVAEGLMKSELHHCKWFFVDRWEIDSQRPQSMPTAKGELVVVVCIRGDLKLCTDGHEVSLTQGQTILVPACCSDNLTIAGQGVFLTAQPGF